MKASVLTLGLLIGAGVVILALTTAAKVYIDGFRGLRQWPEPYGRYYKRWLSLPEGHGDYYQWLAKQKNYREPWATWARLDKAANDN